MKDTEFDSHRFCKNEPVFCSGVLFKVHSVNFESGMIGLHNDTDIIEAHYSHVQTVEIKREPEYNNNSYNLHNSDGD